MAKSFIFNNQEIAPCTINSETCGFSKAQRLGVGRPWRVKVVNDRNAVLDESTLRLHGMLLSDGPESDLAKVDEITETNPILVLENNAGEEVVRVSMTFEQSQ